MTKAPIALAAALATTAIVAACQTPGNIHYVRGTADAPAFVEAGCGGCHAVEPPFLSPNPAAPGFEAIANRRGVDETALRNWLANAHNYPEDMDFDLTGEQVEDIAAYMITLRRDDYEPD